jgi:hypothetical protein
MNQSHTTHPASGEIVNQTVEQNTCPGKKGELEYIAQE